MNNYKSLVKRQLKPRNSHKKDTNNRNMNGLQVNSIELLFFQYLSLINYDTKSNHKSIFLNIGYFCLWHPNAQPISLSSNRTSASGEKTLI